LIKNFDEYDILVKVYLRKANHIIFILVSPPFAVFSIIATISVLLLFSILLDNNVEKIYLNYEYE